MELNEFVQKFADQFDETPIDQFTNLTEFKNLAEWSSLTALSIIAMVDEELEKRITGADIRSSKTIEDLYIVIQSK
jgi:acyl carrier protein